MSRICQMEKKIEALETKCENLVSKMNGLKEHRLVWSLDNAVVGYMYETWGPRQGNQNAGDGQAIEGFERQWGGPLVNGIPSHSSGLPPTTQGFETDTRFAQAERGNDDHRLTYCIDNRNSELDLVIVDTDTRAESLRVYTGCECHSDLTYERYQAQGQPYTSDGQPVSIIPAGEIRIMTVLIHDPGPDFSGFRPIANYAGSEDPVDFVSYQEKPSVSCREIEQLLCGTPYQLEDNESFKPIELTCSVCPGGGGGTDNQSGDFEVGEPAGRTLVNDFYADGNNNIPFELQVRNATNANTPWQACTPSVPFDQIPNLSTGPYDYNRIDNPDGTFIHCFTGTSDLGPSGSATQSVIITGGVPIPAGNGGSPSLYIP